MSYNLWTTYNNMNGSSCTCSNIKPFGHTSITTYNKLQIQSLNICFIPVYNQYCIDYQRTVSEVFDNDPVISAQATSKGTTPPYNRNYSHLYSIEIHLCPRFRDYELINEHGIPREWHPWHRILTTIQHKLPV